MGAVPTGAVPTAAETVVCGAGGSVKVGAGSVAVAAALVKWGSGGPPVGPPEDLPGVAVQHLQRGVTPLSKYT